MISFATRGWRANGRHPQGRRRLRAAVACALLFPSATGCYTYVPRWEGMPLEGTFVAARLSDRGRAELANRIGPGARQITGRVTSVSDTSLALSVSEVTYIPASVTRWNGELVIIPRDVVSGIQERKLSKSRSWLAVGAAAAAVVFISTIAISGFGSDPPSDKLPGGSNPQ